MLDAAEKFMVGSLVAVLTVAGYSKFSDVGGYQVGAIWSFVTGLS